MRNAHWKMFTAIATTLALGFGLNGLTTAHEGHDHGGVEAKTARHHFEVVFTKGGVTLFAHGPDHRAVDVSHATATATFFHPSSPKPWFARELRPAPASPGQAPSSLGVVLDLSKVPASGAKVAFQVNGLPDPAEATATFTVPFTLGGGGGPVGLTITTATKADQPAINAQKVCPVSKEELGSMGVPIKVTRGNRSVFLCCKGCVKQVQADPDKYLRAAAPGEGKTTAR